MSYSQGEATFYYAQHQRRKKAAAALRSAEAGGPTQSGLDFGGVKAFFLIAVLVAFIVAAMRIYTYAVFHVSAFFDAVLSYLTFL